MNIALIGYGKMGKAIEQVALERGHNIVLAISSGNLDEFTEANIRKADVVIEFTRPDAARDNVLRCLNAGVSTICGTTGWNESADTIKEAAEQNNAAFLQTSNFSIGVNIFFEVNRLLARLMNNQPEYDIMIEEVHHTQKKDAPSGTAISLATQMLSELKRKESWVLNDTNNPNAVTIMSHRVDDVPGTHRISYRSAIDDIEITHTAHSRMGFAQGAVLAAEYVAGRKGVYEMKDVLGITTK